MCLSDLISVIIPVYNVEKFLMRCYKSIADQTYSKLEIILIDDGSVDNSGKICDEIAENDLRVKVIHKKNEGLGLARNTGLDMASGDYVVFVDSDDFVKKNYIEIMYKAIKENNADVSSCGIIQYYADGSQYEKPICDIKKFYSEKEEISRFLISMIGSLPEEGANNKIPMSVWHQMYSMKIIKKYKLAFCSEREFISEDIIFQIDYFSKAKSVVLLEETLYFYYCSQVGSLSTKYRENRYLEEVRLSKELFRKLAIIFPEEVYKIQLQGMFLGRVRTCLMMEYLNENNKNFNMIIEDKYLKKIINDYPIERCKLSLRIFYYCIKQEWSTIIRILLYIRKMKK